MDIAKEINMLLAPLYFYNTGEAQILWHLQVWLISYLLKIGKFAHMIDWDMEDLLLLSYPLLFKKEQKSHRKL